jgi:drug/metabolite transporter (DMT)-like permease
MEKLELRKSSSQAKTLGAILAITGAFVMTLYKGPIISMITTHHDSLNHLRLVSQQSNWVLGGLLLAITAMFSSLWNVFQTATVKEYPDEMTIVFFFCFFGTIQSAICTLVIERANLSAWVLHTGVEIIAVVFAAVTGSVFRNGVVTWCFRKKGPVYVVIFKPMTMIIAVIMGIMFLGDTLYLGSVIGAITIALGFYAVIWGQEREKNINVDVCTPEPTENTPLLPK